MKAWDEAGKPKNGAGLGSKSNWVSQLQNWQKEFKKNKQSSEEFVESLKIDFFNDRIFVLTPKGDVLDLPEGATPIDFAYNIHTEIGDRATGAKVNSKMVALKTSLKSGDVVEIIIQKNKKLSAEWINFAKTSLAKNRIKRRLNIGRPPKNFDETKVELIIEAQDRVGLIKDITEILQTFRVNIESISSNVKEDLRPVTYIHFHKKNNGQLERIKTRLKKIPGVETVGEKNKR